MKGLIIVVHYGKWVITEKFIDDIKNYLSDDINLYIVNNNHEILPVNKNEKYIITVNAPSNLGYFGGARYAFNYFDISNYNFIIICNNDTKIDVSDFFNRLKTKIDLYDIIAPSIRTTKGIEQNPNIESGYTFARRIFNKLYFSTYEIAVLLNSMVNIKKRILASIPGAGDETERLIFSPHGSFIIFNRSFFDKGGVIENNLFLYGEEESLSAQAKNLKLKIGFVPSLKIIHDENTTTKRGLSKSKYDNQRFAHQYIKKRYPGFFD
jgi:GT2 family glycosyltransferase